MTDRYIAVLPVARGREESERFTRALLNLAAQGLRTYCSDPESHYLWLSDSAAERRTAADHCQGCPVIVPCVQAANARREKFGGGGVDPYGSACARPTDEVDCITRAASLTGGQRCCSALSAAAPRGSGSLPSWPGSRQVHAAARNDHRRTEFADPPVADLSPWIGRKLPHDSVGCLGALFVGSQHR
jgi:hypothetical protein